ncbi:MAG: hypothetical protein ACREJC_05315, partial [Tepidisphaeraceae bacterium]
MPARKSFPLFALVCLAVGAAFPRTLCAQDSAPPDVENAKHQFVGAVNANAVYVRSGPSDNDYPTMKLDQGASVTVIGLRFDWLKIKPPEGSFCYVAKAYVEKRADGTVGRVTNQLYARVGSSLNALKTKVAMKLEPGTDVAILGEQDEYFKIRPPEGVFLYVNRQFVDPVRPVAQAAQENSQPGAAPTVADAKPEAPLAGSSSPPVGESTPVSDSTVALSEPPATGPATQPGLADADVEVEFDKLETLYAQTTAKPLDQQDIATLQAGYERLASSATLPESLRRIAESKATALKMRAKDREEYLAVMKNQEEMKQRQIALQAERKELEQRLSKTEMKFFEAVGTLRVSSLQQGTGTLYRLTDPATGRSVVYIRSDDQKLA